MKIFHTTQFASAALALMMTSTSLYAGPLVRMGAAQPMPQIDPVQLKCNPGETPKECGTRMLLGNRDKRQPRGKDGASSPPAEQALPRRAKPAKPAAQQAIPPRVQAKPAKPAAQPAARPRLEAKPAKPAKVPEFPMRKAKPAKPAAQPANPPRLQAKPAKPAAAPAARPRLEAKPGKPAAQPAARPRLEAKPAQPAKVPAFPPRLQAKPGQPLGTQEVPPRIEQGQRKGERPTRDLFRIPADTPQLLPDEGQQQARPRPRDRNFQQQAAQPRNDRAAQERLRRGEVRSVTSERGQRIEGEPQLGPRERRPRGTNVVREMGDRTILRQGDQVFVESNERPRMRRNATEIYAENLPNGRVRETVVRRDGTRVVTIRNDYGDVIRRSRFVGQREYVLGYVNENDYGRLEDWRDPGLDMPPLVLDIPRDDYILDAGQDYGADDYYTFLEQPPVEDVERLYSVDEVKRSARIRQKTRRIDLDTITFEFGSSAVPESQISRLEGVAEAIQRMLEKNPAETFLIEGHTDAVGSEYANLSLSDRRAEAVAEALSNVFEIPPENLSTQGYGEEFLKVQTDAPERENRRVSVRRITPLVAPVAANE